MKYLVCLPYMYEPYKNDCMATCKIPSENMMLIDNTVTNIGFTKAYNIAIDKVLSEEYDWLIGLSAAIRFGEPGGLDFIQALEDSNSLVVEHITNSVPVFGWHLIAFSRECLIGAGRKDENFFSYYEDLDYSMRIQRAFKNTVWQQWEKVVTDLTDMGSAHCIKLGGLISPSEPYIRYFIRKWGRHPDISDNYKLEYEHPFHDESKPVTWYPVPPDSRSILLEHSHINSVKKVSV